MALGTLPGPGAGTASGSGSAAREGWPCRPGAVSGLLQPQQDGSLSSKQSLVSAAPALQSQAHTPAGPKDVTDQDQANESGPRACTPPTHAAARSIAQSLPLPPQSPLGASTRRPPPCFSLPALRGDPLRRRLPDLSPALLPTGERGSSRAQSHCPGDTAAGATKPMGERTRQSSPVKACVTNRPFSRALAFAYKAKGPVSCRQHCRNVPGLPGEGTKGPWEGQSLIPGQPSLPCRSD